MDKFVVNREIVRMQQYELIIKDLSEMMIPSGVKSKTVRLILLAYFYNKIMDRSIHYDQENESDPFFIIGYNQFSIEQLIDDINYIKDVEKLQLNFTLQEVIDKIESGIINANRILSTVHLQVLIPRKQNGSLTTKYNSRIIRVYDPMNLSSVNINYAFALSLRYKYIESNNYNLAVDYRKEGYKKDCCAEGFASSFNHYFNNYCSAFYDLEFVFGSIGSFFAVSDWPNDFIQVNPPFDGTIMKYMALKVVHDLKYSKRQLTFRVIVPNWIESEFMRILRKSEFLVEERVHPKGTMPFINYHNDPSKYICPCDIYEGILKN
jgi:hypothetical protein